MTAKTEPQLADQKPPLLKQAALQIISGGSAGFVEVCIMHPLDLVKTRLQIQNKALHTSTANAATTASSVNQVRQSNVKRNI